MSDELRKLAQAATPGPWLIQAPYTREVRHHAYGPLGGTGEICEPHRKCDTAFIAAANPTAVLALLDARDSLAAQLEDTKQVIVTFRATMEQMRRERDEARKSLRTVAHEIGVCHCWDFGCEPGPTDAIVDAVKRMRDSETCEMEARVALDEARATNAKLHRRAQGVEASKPEDEETIRRLRADVRGQAKHAGYVAGYVMRLRCALSDAQHEASKAQAKLARIREMPALRYETATTACEALADIIRIIDEKEGGQ